jgi:NADPH:quinone reductase
VRRSLEPDFDIEDLGTLRDADLADDQPSVVRDDPDLAVVTTAEGAHDVAEVGRVLHEGMVRTARSYDGVMRGARIGDLGQSPVTAEIEGDGSVDVVAVALNPIDVAVANGRLPAGHPPLPYVPGVEALARIGGERFYLFGDGFGTLRDGFLVERVDFPREKAVPVPEGLGDVDAAVCGVAGLAGWLPVATKASVDAGDRVLVLGATGTVGSVAVQAARLLGADRIVGAGRNAAALEHVRELGADETVVLEGDDLASRLRDACGGDGPTVVIDPLWGEPARAATQAAAPGARFVQLGQSAGPEATLASADIRFKQLVILGHTNFALTHDEMRDAYTALGEHVAAGRIRIDAQTFPLERVGEAWSAQQQGAKAVVLVDAD